MGTEDTQEATGLSRRDLLKRSAVAGGIVWASPSVLASAAGAQETVVCPEGSCPVYHVLKINTDDEQLPALADLCTQPPPDGEDEYVTDKSDFSGLFCDITAGDIPADAEVVETTCEDFQSHIQSITNTGTQDVVVLKPGWQFVKAYSKKQDCTNAVSATDCRTATFNDISSHLEILYCGPS